jgi:beta-hydroxylase
MFVDPAAYPFVEGLRLAFQVIRDECRALPADAYEPWVQREMYGQGWVT